MLCIFWNVYKFLYCPCSKIKWTQENRLYPLRQKTNSWDQDGLLRGAQEIIERDLQCPKRCVWTDHSLEQYQCDQERSKGDTENHKETLREPNNLVFRLTHSTSYKKLESLSEDEKLWFQCSPLESGNICLSAGGICQKTETFLIW